MSEEPVASERHCAMCGYAIPPDANKCTYCDAPQYKRQCVVCGKNLPKLAEHCNECKSYQNWRRYFGMSQTVLALLVALISILTPLLKQIADYANRHSATTIAFQSATDQEITINVMNTGRARSVLRRYWLRSKDHRVFQDAELDLVSGDSKELTVVSGDEERTLRLKPLTGLTVHVPYEQISDALKTLDLTLVVEVQEDTGRVERMDTFSASRIERFILTYAPQVAKGAPS